MHRGTESPIVSYRAAQTVEGPSRCDKQAQRNTAQPIGERRAVIMRPLADGSLLRDLERERETRRKALSIQGTGDYWR